MNLSLLCSLQQCHFYTAKSWHTETFPVAYMNGGNFLLPTSKCGIPEQKRLQSVPSPEWLEVSSCSKLWKDKTTIWRNDFEDWDPHTVCSSANWQDPHKKIMREVDKTSFLCNSNFWFSLSWSNPEMGCTRMNLLAHYHRPWSCKCIYSLENRSLDLSINAERWELPSVFLPQLSVCALVLARWELCVDTGANLNGTSWSDSDCHANRIRRHGSVSLLHGVRAQSILVIPSS